MRSLVADLVLLRLPEMSGQPMNATLYSILRQAILDGAIAERSRLPASRDLARELSIARNTVVQVYARLQSEGLLEARTGSGSYVAHLLPDLPGRPSRTRAIALPGAAPQLSRRGRHLVSEARASPRQWGAFMPGVPDVSQVPREQLVKHMRSVWRNPPPELLTYAHGGGLPRLKRALAEHLSVTRQLVCEPEQILITEGSHQALDLVTRMLGEVGDRAWVEDPGYWGTRSVMSANGIELVPVPVDGDGMRLPEAQPVAPPRFIFLTPSHQYPLGSVMSLVRRRQVLALARQWGAVVIEDDYDSELRYAGKPIASLQGLEPDAPVIYVGTFSKTLYPALRLGYMVLPEPLVASFQVAQAELYREGHGMTQAVLAAFIEQGQYATHVRRMRLLYARRCAMLCQLIRHRLGPDWLAPGSGEAGLHVVLDLPAGMDDCAVQARIQEDGVLTRALSRYYLDPTQARSGLLLGHACVPEAQMMASFEVVVRAIEAASRSRPGRPVA